MLKNDWVSQNKEKTHTLTVCLIKIRSDITEDFFTIFVYIKAQRILLLGLKRNAVLIYALAIDFYVLIRAPNKSSVSSNGISHLFGNLTNTQKEAAMMH